MNVATVTVLRDILDMDGMPEVPGLHARCEHGWAMVPVTPVILEDRRFLESLIVPRLAASLHGYTGCTCSVALA